MNSLRPKNESLARFYRPKTFDEICGQTSIIKILKRQLDLHEFKNVYLFCGASGSGKTTTARAFANAINHYAGSIIEIDAASNNGVENVRTLVKAASERAVDSEYKIIIVDECFTEDTLVQTSTGNKKINEICVGESVLTLNGFNKVLNVQKKIVPTSKLLTIKLSNGKKINVTNSHLFLTTNGWIKASNLMNGDELIDRENLSNMWENVQYGSKNMFNEMREHVGVAKEEIDTSTEDLFAHLRDMWETVGINENMCTENMFKGMLQCVIVSETKGILSWRTWDGKTQAILRKNKNHSGNDNSNSRTNTENKGKNEKKQSNVKSRSNRKNEEHENVEWDIALMDGGTRGEWKVYKGARDVIPAVRRFLGHGISCENRCEKEQQSSSLSYMLQIRPCLTYDKIGDRGGWQNAYIEKTNCTRYKETDFIRKVRVESVEIYKRGSEQQYTKCDEQYTEVYDLSVEGSPTYFANDVLVHNCHVLTSAAWQSFLKCIEEPPKYTIFIFCTTDPQKIPDTILNRVMRFNFNKIPSHLINERLQYICKQEGYTNYEQSCDYISKICNGQMRDGIALLDKCASYSEDISIENVFYALGDYSYDTYFNLINNIIDGNTTQVLNNLDSIYNSGNDLKLFIEKFLEFCVDVEKYIITKDCSITKIPKAFEEKIKSSINFEKADSYYLYIMNKLLDLKNDLKTDVNPYSTIQVIFMKLCRCQ